MEADSAPDDAASFESEPPEDEDLEVEPLEDELESADDELDGTHEAPVKHDTEAIPVVTSAAGDPFEAVEADEPAEEGMVEEPDSGQAPPPVPGPPPLEESSPTVAESPEEPEGATLIAAGPRLVAKFEDGSELEYTIGVRPTTIGRAPGNVIEVAGDSVSRRHAEIALTGDGYAVRDLETRNGTWVNGERLAEERVLADGDLVQIGAVVFVFRGR